MNKFLEKVGNTAYTENGAVSYMTTGSAIVDQFGKAGTYRGRFIGEVYMDQEKLWDENPEFAVKFPFYLRMITRKVKTNDGTVTENPQRGQGVRDESFKRLLWLAKKQPDIFYQNLWLVPIVGSWKDLWSIMLLDEEGALDKGKMFEAIAEGLRCEAQSELVKKYLPQIRSAAKCTTERASKLNRLAKEFCNWAGWTYEEYRKCKALGTAHKFQQYISQGKYDLINWNAIPGKALLELVSSKFLANHNLLDNYLKWISNSATAKFNGYPYELGMKLLKVRDDNSTKTKALKMTVDAQFENLIKTAKEGTGGIKGNVWCALDTSSSMEDVVTENGATAYDICISLGIYFSTLNEGDFHKNVIMFSNISNVKQLSGTFSEMYRTIRRDRTAWGDTNFLSVIDEIVRVRRYNPEIPLESYPQTLLVVSDMQFNPTDDYWATVTPAMVESNYEAMKSALSTYFPKDWVDNFKVIWWQVDGERVQDVPSTLDHGGTYFLSGFDGSIITLLLGGDGETTKPETGEVSESMRSMTELINDAFNQDILNLVRI